MPRAPRNPKRAGLTLEPDEVDERATRGEVVKVESERVCIADSLGWSVVLTGHARDERVLIAVTVHRDDVDPELVQWMEAWTAARDHSEPLALVPH